MVKKIEKVVTFLRKTQLHKILMLGFVYLILYIPMEFCVMKYALIYATNTSWNCELFIYANIALFVFSLWILILILGTEICTVILSDPKNLKKRIRIIKCLYITALLISMILKIVLLCFTYKLNIGNYEKIIVILMCIEIFLCLLVGLIMLLITIIYVFITINRIIKKRSLKK